LAAALDARRRPPRPVVVRIAVQQEPRARGAQHEELAVAAQALELLAL
jgi:hypothetical protein